MFEDRRQAGRLLGERLKELDLQDPLVLGIPRGGVRVASAVAEVLGGRLDIFVTAKIRAPHQPELGLGAVAAGDVVVLDEEILSYVGVSDDYLNREIEARKQEIGRRQRRYRGDRPSLEVEGRSVVVVDDGVATGGTALGALRALKQRRPSRLTLAVPVAARESMLKLESEADEVIALEMPDPFLAVGRWYRHFDQLTDEEVAAELEGADR